MTGNTDPYLGHGGTGAGQGKDIQAEESAGTEAWKNESMWQHWGLHVAWGSIQCGRGNGGQGGWESTRDQIAFYLTRNVGEYKVSEQETDTRVRKII